MVQSLLPDNVPITNLLLLFVTGLITYVAIFYYRYFTRPNPLPGPIPLPIVGNALQYPGDAGKWIGQLRQIYGDMFEVYAGTTRAICLCRTDLIEKLTTTSSTSNFFFRAPPNDGFDDLGLTDKGMLLNRNYDDWSYHRRILDKTVLTPQIAKETVKSTQVLFEEMEGLWKRLGNDKEIDLVGWLPRFTFENVLFLTTTLRVQSLINYYNVINPKDKIIEPEGTLQNSEAYLDSIKLFFDAIHFYLLAPKLLRNISPGLRGLSKRFINNKDWLFSNLLGIVKARRAQIESSEEKIVTKDLLTQLLTINTDKDVTQGNFTDDKHTERINDDDARGIMLEVVGAGTFTTANTFCFVVHQLAHYPEVKKRMVQELDNVLGSDPDGHITFDQVNKLEYTNAVFKEACRMFTAVPVNLRANAKPDKIAQQTFPANTLFLIDMEGIHHSSNWSDPEIFNPSRWLTTSSDTDVKQRKNDAFLQFGFGARTCPGRNLASTEIKTLMALLYRKYDIEIVNKVFPIKYKYEFIKFCDELKVKIKTRN